MERTVTLTELGPGEFTARLDRVMAVYAAALNPPAGQLAGRETILERHSANPRFRALAAVDDGGEIVGFSYGFHGAPGQWWHDTVLAGLTALDRHATGWLADSYEVAELHVLPAWQGRGIGAGLLFSLASWQQERTAVLSTHDTESRARRLYRGAGFVDLLTQFRFAGGEPAYAVMGAELPLRDARPSSS
jgi:GNAT superfamily N-acetyltransferase